jgi:hypothetical protein
MFKALTGASKDPKGDNAGEASYGCSPKVACASPLLYGGVGYGDIDLA